MCFKDNSKNCLRAEASIYTQRDQPNASKGIYWVTHLNPPKSHCYGTTLIIIVGMLSPLCITCHLPKLDGKTPQPASLPLSETYLKIPVCRYLVRASCSKYLLEGFFLVINHNAGKGAQKNDRNLPSSLSCNHERINYIKPPSRQALAATTEKQRKQCLPPTKSPLAYTDVRILQPSSLGSFQKPDPGGLHEPDSAFIVCSCSPGHRSSERAEPGRIPAPFLSML